MLGVLCGTRGSYCKLLSQEWHGSGTVSLGEGGAATETRLELLESSECQAQGSSSHCRLLSGDSTIIPCSPEVRDRPPFIKCLLCTQHSTQAAQGLQAARIYVCSLPRRKGSWDVRDPASFLLSERKWGQLCLDSAENSRANARGLKALAPQTCASQQVCQKLAGWTP